MPGSLERGRFTYFPVVPGRWSSPSRCARPFCATGRRWSRSNCPSTLRDAYLRAVERAAARCRSSSTATNTRTDRAIYVPVEPADPFTEAIRSGAGNRRGDRVRRSGRPASARICPTLIPTPTRCATFGLDKYVEAYRVYPQARSEEIARARRRHRLEAARLRSAGARAGGGFAEPARSGAGCHGAAAGAAHGAAAARGRAAAQSASRMSGRDHHRVSVPAGTLRTVSRPQ